MARSAVGDKDWYAILELDPSAGAGEVKAAHRRLAKRWHPDTNPSPGAHERMIELNRAREVLLDPVARAAFDLSHRRQVQQEAARARVEATETPVRTVRIRTKVRAPRKQSPPDRQDDPQSQEQASRASRNASGIHGAEPDFTRDWFVFLGVTPNASDGEIREALRRAAVALQVPGISAAEFSRRGAELRTANASIGTAAARAAYLQATVRR